MSIDQRILLLDLGGVLADLGDPVAAMGLNMTLPEFWKTWTSSPVVRALETGQIDEQEQHPGAHRTITATMAFKAPARMDDETESDGRDKGNRIGNQRIDPGRYRANPVNCRIEQRQPTTANRIADNLAAKVIRHKHSFHQHANGQ